MVVFCTRVQLHRCEGALSKAHYTHSSHPLGRFFFSQYLENSTLISEPKTVD